MVERVELEHQEFTQAENGPGPLQVTPSAEIPPLKWTAPDEEGLVQVSSRATAALAPQPQFGMDWGLAKPHHPFTTSIATQPASHNTCLLHCPCPFAHAHTTQFLVNEKQFNEQRVRNAVGRIKANKTKANQGRLESFFTSLPKPATADKAKRECAEGCATGVGGRVMRLCRGLGVLLLWLGWAGNRRQKTHVACPQ